MISSESMPSLKHAFSKMQSKLSGSSSHPGKLAFMASYSDRLTLALKESGHSRADLAAALGVTSQAVGDAIRGKTTFSAANNSKAADFLGVRSDWLADERGPMIEPSSRKPSNAPTMQAILSWEHPDDLPPGEFVMIPRMEVKLSAGPGNEQVEITFTELQPQAFRADWIRKQRLKPSKLACMTADGRSMEPVVWDGDSLVIDTAQTDVKDGQVYAIWYDGGERVKRLYRLPGGGLRIKSDNPEHPTMELTADYHGQVRIIGRVVHRSGAGGL